MSVMVVLMLVAGLVLLVLGAESLVRGAGSLALRLGITPLVVGLTVVAFGTSAPELAVSVVAALRGSGDLVVGNVVGSNIANIALILGVSAMIMPITVHAAVIRREAPVMLGVAALLPALALLGHSGSAGGSLDRWQGAVFVAVGLAYTIFLYMASKREGPEVRAEFESGVLGEATETSRRRSLPLDLLLIVGGIGLLVLGSSWLVDGAVAIAKALGVSDLVIGLTVVAVGTSLPELATSVVAALRKQPDMSVGNIVGSNISNLAFVLGSSAVVAPIGVSREAMVRDIPVMLGLTALCIVLMRSGRGLSRIEGALLFVAYALYTVWVVWAATAGAP